MKVIVFGGSGFLGSHLADALTEAGHDVTIFDVLPSRYLQPKQKMVIGNILNRKTVAQAMKGMSAVYHFAGFADLNDSAKKPLETVEQNILGTAILLEAAANAKVKRFIYASTIYVYSNRGNFYRCSKQAAELYVEEFQRRYGLDFTILRFGTLFGPRADEKNSVWRYLYEGLYQKKITCNADGNETREYVHVRDAARLSVEILGNAYKNKHIIITGPYPMKVKDLLNMMKEILNNNAKIKYEIVDNTAHYNYTPFSFMPSVGQKLVSHFYEDMGQAMLECLHEMHGKKRQGSGIKTL